MVETKDGIGKNGEGVPALLVRRHGPFGHVRFDVDVRLNVVPLIIVVHHFFGRLIVVVLMITVVVVVVAAVFWNGGGTAGASVVQEEAITAAASGGRRSKVVDIRGRRRFERFGLRVLFQHPTRGGGVLLLLHQRIRMIVRLLLLLLLLTITARTFHDGRIRNVAVATLQKGCATGTPPQLRGGRLLWLLLRISHHFNSVCRN